MNTKKIIWLVVILLLGIAAWYGYKEYNRTNKSLAGVSADFKIDAISLLKEFENNDSLAGDKYNGKVIEAKGMVKSIEQDADDFYTLVIGDSASLSALRCVMDSAEAAGVSLVKPGSLVVVRGACTGYIKDEMGLGADLVLNRCILADKKE
jgi:hypothetical protein